MVKDPGANPQARWASFHLIVTQQPRQHATRIPAAREGDTAEAGGEARAQAPLLRTPCAHLAPGALLQRRQTAAQRAGSATPPGPVRRPQSLGPGVTHGGCCEVAQAKSTGQKRAELWLEGEVGRRDMLLCLEGRHEEQETTKDPRSLSVAL